MRIARLLSGNPEVTRREVVADAAPKEEGGRLAQLEAEVTLVRSQLESALERLGRLEETLGGGESAE